MTFRKQRDEKATPSKKPKNKINVYDERLAELIKSGELKSKGVDGLFKTIQKEFNSQVHGLTKKAFRVRMDKLLWTKEVESQLKNIVGHDLPLAKFEEHYNYIPRKMIEEKARRLSGVSNFKNPVQFLKGLGRIGDLSDMDGNFKLPKTTISSPVVIPTVKPNPTVLLINGANIGLKHERLIKNNPIKRALIDAKLVNIIEGGWSKISRDLDNTALPEFDGPVLIAFGPKETELIAAAAYWDLKRGTLIEWNKLGAEIRLVKSAISSADKRGLTPVELKELERRLAGLINEQSRTIISNISVEDRQRFYRKVLNFIVKKFEEAVPNSKVVSQGTFFAKVQNEVIEFNVPKHLRVSDGLLAENVKKHGPRVLLGDIPKTVIICHPYALNMRFTVRESVVKNGQRGSVQFYVAPIAVDDKFLSETLEDSGHPI